MLGIERALVYAYLVIIVLVGDIIDLLGRCAKWLVVKIGSAWYIVHIKRTVTVDKLDAINEDWYLAVLEREQWTRDRAWAEYIKQINWSEAREKSANKRYNALSASLTQLLDD